MAKDNSKDPAIPQPQQIPLAKIHDLPGVLVGKQPDKSYGGLVTSIQAGGVKEPVVVRQVENGEYQLVTGYRRRRASELAKKQDIPALVYEMSIQEAQDYHHRVKNNPDMAIPGRPVPVPDKGQNADLKGTEKTTPAADGKALQICYDRGFDWGGLYEIYNRCSCWCCPLQRIGELRKLRHHHPELWAKLKELDQRALDQFGHTPLGRFKDNWTIAALEERFAAEDRELCLFNDKTPKPRKRCNHRHKH